MDYMTATFNFQPYMKYTFKEGETISVFSESKDLNGLATFLKEEKGLVHLHFKDKVVIKERKLLVLEKTN